MTGLEKIIEKIMDESNANCESIISKANEQASEIAEQAKQQGEKLAAEISAKAEKQVDNIEKTAKSGAQMRFSNALLATKSELINSALEKSLEALNGMPDKEYFDSLKKLAVANAQPKDGVMLLSEKDIKRLPSDFEAAINSAVASSGAKITVNKQPAPIKSGFILVYGDIEINCTFDALLESYRDELKDKVCEILFA